jgi:hypothetical protein
MTASPNGLDLWNARNLFERTFYLSLAMSAGLGKGANGVPFQRQWLDNE